MSSFEFAQLEISAVLFLFDFCLAQLNPPQSSDPPKRIIYITAVERLIVYGLKDQIEFYWEVCFRKERTILFSHLAKVNARGNS